MLTLGWRRQKAKNEDIRTSATAKTIAQGKAEKRRTYEPLNAPAVSKGSVETFPSNNVEKARNEGIKARKPSLNGNGSDGGCTVETFPGKTAVTDKPDLHVIPEKKAVDKDGLVTQAGEDGASGIAHKDNSTSQYMDQLNNMSENKIKHIIEGSTKLGHNHKWDCLVKEKNWDEIKKIICNVMEKGVESPRGKAWRKVSDINGYKVEVRFQKMADGVVKISDAFVR